MKTQYRSLPTLARQVLIFAGTVLFACQAGAVTRTVTSNADSGPGSLRDAVAASADFDTIEFSVRGTITLTSGQISITKRITIGGPGADQLTIQRSGASGTPAFRLFHVKVPVENANIAISGLTLANGLLTDTYGDGACIYNDHSKLTVTTCYFRNNQASKNGGAIYNDGAHGGNYSEVFADGCTFIGNTAGESGGAVYNNGYDGTGVALLVNCTLYHNSAGLSGGAVYAVDDTNGFLSYSYLWGCTMVENGGPSSLEADTARISLKDDVSYSSAPVTFVQRNGGVIRSLGYNLGQPKDAPFLSGTGDQIVSEYALDPVGPQSNGGTAPTIAVVRGPAVDGGAADNLLQSDARGVARPIDFASFPNAPGGNGNDIGAYEANDLVQKGLAGDAFLLVVNSLDDHDDGTCGEADCTLREAIARTNAARPVLTASTFRISFAATLTGAIVLKPELGQLRVTGGIEIIGPGARSLAVSGGGNVRVFQFTGGGQNVITGLTIRNGNVFATGGGGSSAFGGGILNQSTLTLNDCHVINNASTGDGNTNEGGAGGNGFGGGIHNTGILTLNRTTLSGNVATGGIGGANTGVGSFYRGGNGGSGLGGAISNTGTLTINNCTIAGNGGTGVAGGNGSNGGNGGNAVGGVYSTGNTVITATTISGNNAAGGAGGAAQGKFSGTNGTTGTAAGGLSAAAGTNRVRNTICAGNTGREAEGTITSDGYNLIGNGDFSSGFNNTGDQVGTSAAPINPNLGPLQDYGGATDTMPPALNSPALDAGNSFGLTTDQRGSIRPVDRQSTPNASSGDGSDIGAVEINQIVPTRLANVSTRLRVGTGDSALIGGFIITGNQPKKVIIRAIGPSLAIAGRLANPTLELYSGQTLLKTNDNWVDSPEKQAIVDSNVAPTNDLESAIVATLPANGSGYTAVVRGVNNTGGIGLVEIYDLDPIADSKLANISTRGLVQTGDNVLIAGTIILGQDPQKVIIRAIGPSLSVTGKMADPTLELRDQNGTVLEANDNWVDSPNKQAIIDSTIPPTNNLESAIVRTLPSNGAQYTAIVRGTNNTTGIAVVEVYALN